MTKQAIVLVICLLNTMPFIAAGASLLCSGQPALKWEDALISASGEQGILARNTDSVSLPLKKNGITRIHVMLDR